MRELLLYGTIYSFTASEFITSINEVEDGELVVRVNSPGGDVMYGWGMIAKYREFEGKKTVKVDGQAASMAAFFTLFADNVEAIEQSKFLLHRAAFPSWMEASMTEDEKAYLIAVNKDLEAALREKVDVEKFEKTAGVSIKEMFSLDKRLDITLTAKQAKQVGIVSKIISLSTSEKKMINAEMARLAASANPIEWTPFQVEETQATTQELIKNHTMTISELKEKHPALYAQIASESVQQGIEQERDRVGAWSAFMDIDAKRVKEGIASGKNISQTEMAELTLQATLKANASALAGENKKPETNENPEGEKDEKTKALEAFNEKLLNAAGVTPKTV
jgi:ATP-dependent protease ClpP protease subunit